MSVFFFPPHPRISDIEFRIYFWDSSQTTVMGGTTTSLLPHDAAYGGGLRASKLFAAIFFFFFLGLQTDDFVWSQQHGEYNSLGQPKSKGWGRNDIPNKMHSSEFLCCLHSRFWWKTKCILGTEKKVGDVERSSVTKVSKTNVTAIFKDMRMFIISCWARCSCFFSRISTFPVLNRTIFCLSLDSDSWHHSRVDGTEYGAAPVKYCKNRLLPLFFLGWKILSRNKCLHRISFLAVACRSKLLRFHQIK